MQRNHFDVKNIFKKTREKIRDTGTELTLILTVIGLIVTVVIDLYSADKISFSKLGIFELVQAGMLVLLSVSIVVFIGKTYRNIVFSYRLRKTEYLDRSQYVLKFEDSVARTSTSSRVICLEGESGTGKSVLLQLYKRKCLAKKLPIALIDFRQAGIDRVGVCDEILSQINRTNAKYVAKRRLYDSLLRKVSVQSNPITLKELQTIEVELQVLTWQIISRKSTVFMKRPSCVLLFDTVERIRDEGVIQLLEYIIGANLADKRPPVLLVFAGNAFDHLGESFLNERVIAGNLLLKRYSLQMIGELLVQRFRVADPEIILRVDKITSGHPLTVSLLVEILKFSDGLITNEISALEQGSMPSEKKLETMLAILSRDLEGIVGSNLSEIIQLCAVPRVFNKEILETLVGHSISPEVFRLFTKLPFVKSFLADGYYYHELIRNLLVEILKRDSPSVYSSMNKKLVNYYFDKISSGGDSDKITYTLEYLYHSLCASESSGLYFTEQLFDEISNQDPRLWVSVASEIKNYPFKSIDKNVLSDFYQFKVAWLLNRDNNVESKLESLSSTPGLNPLILCLIYLTLGRVNHHANWEKAILFYTKGLELANLHIGLLKTSALIGVAELYRLSGEVDKAKQYYEQAIIDAEIHENLNALGYSLVNFGNMFRQQDDWETAWKKYDAAIEKFTLVRNHWGVGLALQKKGDIQRFYGKWKDAYNSYEASRRIFESMDVKHFSQVAVRKMADICMLERNWNLAEKMYIAARLSFVELGSIFDIAIIDGNLAIILGERGEVESATKLFIKSIEDREMLGDWNGKILGTMDFVRFLIDHGCATDASRLLESLLLEEERISSELLARRIKLYSVEAELLTCSASVLIEKKPTTIDYFMELIEWANAHLFFGLVAEVWYEKVLLDLLTQDIGVGLSLTKMINSSIRFNEHLFEWFVERLRNQMLVYGSDEWKNLIILGLKKVDTEENSKYIARLRAVFSRGDSSAIVPVFLLLGIK